MIKVQIKEETEYAYLWNLKHETKQEQIQRYTEQTGGCQWGGQWGNGQKR